MRGFDTLSVRLQNRLYRPVKTLQASIAFSLEIQIFSDPSSKYL
jgi:hypothetical protein